MQANTREAITPSAIFIGEMNTDLFGLSDALGDGLAVELCTGIISVANHSNASSCLSPLDKAPAATDAFTAGMPKDSNSAKQSDLNFFNEACNFDSSQTKPHEP